MPSHCALMRLTLYVYIATDQCPTCTHLDAHARVITQVHTASVYAYQCSPSRTSGTPKISVPKLQFKLSKFIDVFESYFQG